MTYSINSLCPAVSVHAVYAIEVGGKAIARWVRVHAWGSVYDTDRAQATAEPLVVNDTELIPAQQFVASRTAHRLLGLDEGNGAVSREVWFQRAAEGLALPVGDHRPPPPAPTPKPTGGVRGRP